MSIARRPPWSGLNISLCLSFGFVFDRQSFRTSRESAAAAVAAARTYSAQRNKGQQTNLVPSRET